ncbi:S8 family serine peptidase [Thalassotalea sp. ND16A]|uniref:S8 family serine peptidase n=1 Tax=Thalassotalea sp. ND16A TaxID=1535422 RepID=UPI00051A0D9B|nr:S8 family serine peptidase [Thalassotalea sp. ND16A]KGJ87858.1 Cucumisin [Thalassotalea sp. ND16A]
MFNLNKVSVMVVSALYVGAVGAATTTDVPAEQKWINAPAEYAPKPVEREQYDWSGLSNQTIKKQHKVFIAEEGISGIHKYIVQLEDAPISAYDGGIKGLASTRELVASSRVATKSPLNLKQAKIATYQDYLFSKQTNFVAQAKAIQGLDVKVGREFSVSLNGFVTELTQDQASRLAKVPGVKYISRERIYQLNTFGTPEQTGANKVWTESTANSSNMGEGTIVGIIDTGINTDHPSFAAVGDDGYTHINPLGGNYLGDCADSPEYCNDKLIGVYSYPEITQAYSDPVFDESRPAIGEDYHSHGSHVAGTAAGNILKNVPYKETELTAQGSGTETGLVLPQVSGMAPHANIISYQVCWPGGGGDHYAGCPSSAILAAIEQSAIDNVDVINASLGSLEQDPWSDPIEQAFMNTAKSGVFVAVAAGNSGPDLYTADHSSPWVTTVAAHTPSHTVEYKDNSLEQMSGGDTPAPADIIGASGTFDSLTGIIVNAENFENANESYSRNVKNCDKPFPEGTFDLADDPATADIDESEQDVIVVCKRSYSPLIYKADNIAAGGAEGLVIYNQSAYQDNNKPVVPYAIPTTLIKAGDGSDLTSWLNSGSGHMGTITGTEVLLEEVDQERVAYFSGRGPSYFGLDTLFVDIAAPGVDTYAPASDDQPFNNNPRTSDWMSMSGTSMASPHVAGAAAILRQSHPDWSPMAVQSALMLTATNGLKNARFFNNYVDDGFDSSLQDMGSGRMRVDLADKTGLFMNESVENMDAANPNLGGHEKRLNTAYMVDTECPSECSFVRTFTATEDATWTIAIDKWLGNWDVTVEPASFSIKAGETQSIVVTANSKHESGAISYRNMTGNQGQIVLTSDNVNSPILELPLWTYSDNSGLPEYVKINAHRTSAMTQVGPLNTSEITEFTARSYGMVKGDKTSAHIMYDTTGNDPFDLTIDEEGNESNINHIEWVTVPEGARSIAAQIVGDKTTDMLMFMGQDLNGDGMATGDELHCLSTSYDFANFCNITEPNAGNYWTIVMNIDRPDWGETDEGHTVSLVTGVVTDNNGGLTVSGPGTINGYEEYNVELAYNLPDMEIGDVYFGGFDLGSNANDAGNLGFVPVTISQVDDDVTFTSNMSAAKPGDLVEFEISVIANNEAEARDFVLDVAMPASIQIVPESIMPSNATPVTPVLTDNILSLAGIQETTRDVPRNYKVTNSNNDQMCNLSSAGWSFPGYLDLRPLGWRTLADVQGSYRNEYEYKLKDLMNTEQNISFPFFNKFHFENIKLNPAGLVTFGDTGRTTAFHVELPEAISFPPAAPYIIAPFWAGDNIIPEQVDSIHPNHHLNAGITPTYTWQRDWLALEWDNVERSRADGQLVDFEMFLRMNINYEPGEFEMLFAYENLQLADSQGSIGFKAADGMILVGGDMPLAVNVGDGIAYNNVDDVVEEQLIICMDYTGPEQSQFNVKFKAYVSEAAAGQNHIITLDNGLIGSDNEQITIDLAVTGNIQLVDIADMTIMENDTVSFEVRYADENSVSNMIEVSGDNFTSEVSGHDSGSSVTLIPNAHYHGETEVMVKVSDNVNMTDSAVTVFNLTVESDGVELGCTDSSATNFDANANSDDGSCQAPVEPEKKKSSGGSFGWLMFGLLPLVSLRRKNELH